MSSDPVADHAARAIGTVEGVMAQIVPGVVRTDVVVVGPDAERPYRTLISTGMSSVAVPGTDDQIRTEVVLGLPADWPMPPDETSHWPFALLQNVAAYPHITGVVIEPWETLALAEPPAPLGPGTELVACLVMPPQLLAEETWRFSRDGTSVLLMALVPIYQAELDYARSEGAFALAELLLAAGVTELLDPRRPPVVAAEPVDVSLDGLELPDKVDDQLAALPAVLRAEERVELLARAQLGMFDRGLLVLTDQRLLFLSGLSDEPNVVLGVPRTELQTLWAHDEHVVVRAGDVRELFGSVRPRERVAELAAVGPKPDSADAQVAKLTALASDALGRMTGELFRGRIVELAVDLAADEDVRFLSDGKLDRVNGLVVLTDRRLIFLGEAIRRAKRLEEHIPVERIRGHSARTGMRSSLAVDVEGERELELRMGRAEVRRLADALDRR